MKKTYKKRVINLILEIRNWIEFDFMNYSTDTEHQVVTYWSNDEETCLQGQELNEQKCQELWEKWTKYLKDITKM